VKVVAISDLHGYLPKIEPCDLLLIAGDICPYQNHNLLFQKMWLNTTFRDWLGTVPAKYVVAIPGNHDLIFEQKPHEVPTLPWFCLIDNWVEVDGVTIYGIPWQRRFFDWAFNLDEPELDKKYEAIPDCDIIVSHGPPFGYGDQAPRGRGFENVGSKVFLRKIEEIKPWLVVFGHIHEGVGEWIINDDKTLLANVTHVNGKYEPVHRPRMWGMGV